MTDRYLESIALLENALESGRAQLLLSAAHAVLQDRNADYGDPEDNFRDIAALWSIFTGHPFTPRQAAIMCGLIKVARMKTSPEHPDHLVDLAGYAACAADCSNDPVE